MLKPSEIIRMAMNHPSYLAEDGQNWLCGVVGDLLENQEITLTQYTETIDLIAESLEGEAFLRSYLYKTNKIKSRHTSYQSQEYKQAAFEHWNKLIEKLEKEGE